MNAKTIAVFIIGLIIGFLVCRYLMPSPSPPDKILTITEEDIKGTEAYQKPKYKDVDQIFSYRKEEMEDRKSLFAGLQIEKEYLDSVSMFYKEAKSLYILVMLDTNRNKRICFAAPPKNGSDWNTGERGTTARPGKEDDSIIILSYNANNVPIMEKVKPSAVHKLTCSNEISYDDWLDVLLKNVLPGYDCYAGQPCVCRPCCAKGQEAYLSPNN